jgi:uncharacterized protein with HEPN domain
MTFCSTPNPKEVAERRGHAAEPETPVARRREPILTAMRRLNAVLIAVVINLGIIGEAACRLTDNTNQRGLNIEWPQIIGLRNRIVHEYFGIDSEIVWEIIACDIQGLMNELHSLFKYLPID